MTESRHFHGHTIVEFALIVPMFLTLVFAIIDISRGILMYNILSNVARDGARYAAIHAPNATGACTPSNITQSNLDTAAKGSAGPFASGIAVAVTTACGTDTYGTYFTITASNTFQPVTTLVFAAVSLPLSASSKMYAYVP